jgi:hypothetical protein
MLRQRGTEGVCGMKTGSSLVPTTLYDIALTVVCTAM